MQMKESNAKAGNVFETYKGSELKENKRCSRLCYWLIMVV